LPADDVVFLSPVVRTPQPGEALAKAYLGAALDALLNETFRCVGEWIGPNSAALEFVATIDGIEVDGADFIAWNGADQIVSFKVMIRPLKAIEPAPRRMAAQLACAWTTRRRRSPLRSACAKASAECALGCDGMSQARRERTRRDAATTRRWRRKGLYFRTKMRSLERV
jgi:hypothetical protein